MLQGTETAPASGLCFGIFPPGTTPSNIASANPVVETQLSQGATFTLSTTGFYIVAIGRGSNGSDGPFTFTVSNYHKALIFLPKTKQMARAGKLVVFVHTPWGSPITKNGFVLKLYGIWRNTPSVPASSHLLVAKEPVNGAVVFAYRLPKRLQGKLIRIRVTGYGKRYQPAHSAVRLVRVQAG